ncbi:MAG: hypothetical protein GX837_04860 [Methanomicrobiales archaeon]|nr:hypothetical protein [Methanomicrobiales archaeon]
MTRTALWSGKPGAVLTILLTGPAAATVSHIGRKSLRTSPVVTSMKNT